MPWYGEQSGVKTRCQLPVATQFDGVQFPGREDSTAKEHHVAGVATLCHPNQKRLIIFAGRSNPDLGS